MITFQAGLSKCVNRLCQKCPGNSGSVQVIHLTFAQIHFTYLFIVNSFPSSRKKVLVNNIKKDAIFFQTVNRYKQAWETDAEFKVKN